MIPTTVVLDRITALVASDTTQLGHATLPPKVHLVKAPFTPGAGLQIANLTEANFTGATAKACVTGTQQTFVDPLTGQRIVQLREPADGWHWQAGDLLQLPQTIYGFFVTDNAGAVLYGSALLPQPVTLTGIGDGCDIPQVRFAFLPTSPI